jgi:hypothetical protein
MFPDDKDSRHLVPMRNFLFWQKNYKEGFYELAALSGEPFHEQHVGRGAAFADYDNDGDIDAFIVNQEGSAQLLRNDGGNKNNWIEVRIKCTKSNRTGFGTKVEVEAGGKAQSQESGGQTSYLSPELSACAFRIEPRERSNTSQGHISKRHRSHQGPSFR